MANVYRIKDWEIHYECSDTKKVKSFSKYVPVPNRMDGSGYARLMNHPNGSAHYGAWIALVIVASKCDTRGVLAHKNGEGFDIETISLMTRVPVQIFEELLPRLLSKKIDWLEVIDAQGNCVDDPNASERIRTHSDGIPTHPNVSESNLLEEKRVEESRREESRGEEPAPANASDPSPIKAEEKGDEIREVFEHYRSYHPKSFPKPTSKTKEWGKIRDRLKDGYSVEDLKTAIDGNHSSPFHCGENAEQAKYNSLELIVRDSGKVTQFIELAQARAGPVLTQKTMRTHRAKENYLLKFGDGQNGT